MRIEKLNSSEKLLEVIKYKFNLMVDAVNELQNIQGDQKHIRVSRHPGSMVISLIDNPGLAGGGASGATAEYSGAFKLIVDVEAETPWISVINGSDDESEFCGAVTVGGQLINVPVFESVIGENSHLILTVSYEYVDDAETPTYSAAISMETTVPSEFVAGAWSRIVDLGTCALDDDLNPSAVQSWTGGNVNITDRVQ